MNYSVRANPVLFIWTNVCPEGAPPYFKMPTQTKFLARPVKIQAQTAHII